LELALAVLLSRVTAHTLCLLAVSKQVPQPSDGPTKRPELSYYVSVTGNNDI